MLDQSQKINLYFLLIGNRLQHARDRAITAESKDRSLTVLALPSR